MESFKPDTQYNDLKGEISIDFPDEYGKHTFEAYAVFAGVDTSKYEAVGINVTLSELENDEVGEILEERCIDIIAINKSNKKLTRIKTRGNLAGLLGNIHRVSFYVSKDDLKSLEPEEEIDVS